MMKTMTFNDQEVIQLKTVLTMYKEVFMDEYPNQSDESDELVIKIIKILKDDVCLYECI